ncbi:hypothetical protein KSP40_PGU014256 [Platanthera guangdongensis]|uniref:Uncharacterized protein n=1 Tax=Platanthera guangdongensis TaxID=2320717 RepID=A0ABR2N0N1_9ASPA
MTRPPWLFHRPGSLLFWFMVYLGYMVYLGGNIFGMLMSKPYFYSSTIIKEPVDPFSLVSDELSAIANRLRSMVIAEVPKLAQAAEYFFKMGVEGKRFRPTVLLLMSKALHIPIPQPTADRVFCSLKKELDARQQRIAEITEMIHVGHPNKNLIFCVQ